MEMDFSEDSSSEDWELIDALRMDTHSRDTDELKLIRPYERSYERAFNRYLKGYQFRSPLLGRGAYGREKRRTLEKISELKKIVKREKRELKENKEFSKRGKEWEETFKDAIKETRRKIREANDEIEKLEKNLEQLEKDQTFYVALNKLQKEYNVFPSKKHSRDEMVQRELEINYQNRGHMSGFPQDLEVWKETLEKGTRELNNVADALEEKNALNFEEAKRLWKEEEDARREILEIERSLSGKVARGQKGPLEKRLKELNLLLDENRFQKFSEEKLPRARWYIEQGIEEPSKLRKLSQRI